MRNTDNHDALVGLDVVTSKTSLSKATIYRLMKAGRFPKARQLVPGGRRVAWKEAEVNEWADHPLDWGDPITF